ncbi:hypothetical protein BDA96_02G001700 [Sorghum bicolor]|uniref:Fibronectin type III-like domain-containing protein n=2 Tax=Sorghum bicolor TaxID=4558 RepID=C6JRJ8_SORBI|nr:probable beta-D-xylosidase 7 [Sorghum bicolor]KAG0541270.1 hypothetical protein BDA96_02G001700 [Sorghum bicolor]OQU83361.1 hypothetical protein SORBI_3005G110460 [Sorghum bicolor]|eukprot:XP_002489311.1 probable beta-D-xylosidase 7 [Sorghum bicolor]
MDDNASIRHHTTPSSTYHRRNPVMAAHVSVLLLVPALLMRVAVAGAPPFSCGPSSPSKGLPFCNMKLPASQRAADLVSRMTPAEKASQLGDIANGVPRLGVPSYKWWNEALHGVAISGKGIHMNQGVRSATSFPQVLHTAASFNDNLWFRIGQATGKEARAFYNIGQAEGLTMWSPNVNIFRDPRWGRGQETPGEDPAVASRYGAAFVRGLQGSSSNTKSVPPVLQTSACCKHATAYDLEDWKGVSRYSFKATVTIQDLADTFNPPFRSCVVDGKASCVMCAYTIVNGVPSCANGDLLTKTFRGSWGLDGYVAADCDAVAIMRNSQFYRPTAEDTVAATLKAGLDIDCGPYIQQYAMAAIQKGKLTQQDVDKAVKNLLTTRMRLGHFDGDPKTNVYGNLGAGHICTAEHKNLALEAALDGIVLLKNSAGVLPLKRGTVNSAAVIGHNANDVLALLGNYWGPPCAPTTPLQGIQGYVKNVKFLAGCNKAACNVAATPQATALASSSDAVILFMGLSQEQESEGKDRTTLLLPGNQQSLINAVANAAKRPVILVLLTGGPVDITFAQANPKIGAILWAGYPGQAGGLAIAKVLFGEKNPSGKLPNTWYPEEFTRIPMTDMRMRAAGSYPGRTYRFYNGKTIYKFGYGLSYSKFSHRVVTGRKNPAHNTSLLAAGLAAMTEDNLSYHVEHIGDVVCDQLKFLAVVKVQNHGPIDGKHTALMFLRWPSATDGRPTRQLIGFQSQHIKAGEKANLRFEVSPCEHFSRVRQDGRKVIDKGSHFLKVGKHELEISFGA